MDLPLFRLISGVLLLFLGRRLFWLFVGILGFLSGAMFAARFFANVSDWMLLLIAFVCGLIGVLLAIFLQRAAVAIAGFLAGGLFAATLMEALNFNVAPAIPYLIGGILGAILISVLFDWALIILSSLTGAILVARSLPLESGIAHVVFVVLWILGVIVQARLLKPSTVRRSET
jgi:hypothetical protein